jgi:hypothetical protein
MKADELKTITTDALNKLAALLDAGHSDQLTALFKTMSRFHKYSWHNVCLIASQRPTATRVAGFQAWRTLGRFVRKGEKGIAILAPILGRKQNDAVDEQSRTVLGFRAAYVFDVAHTDGDPLPAPTEASGDPGATFELLTAAIGKQGIAIEHVDDLGGALGTSHGGMIRLLNGLSPAVAFTTLVHEYAHLCSALGYVLSGSGGLRRRLEHDRFRFLGRPNLQLIASGLRDDDPGGPEGPVSSGRAAIRRLQLEAIRRSMIAAEHQRRRRRVECAAADGDGAGVRRFGNDRRLRRPRLAAVDGDLAKAETRRRQGV